MNCCQPSRSLGVQGLGVIPQPLAENDSKRLLRALFERDLDAVGRLSCDSVKL